MYQKIKTPYGQSRVYRVTPKGATQHIMVIPGFSESLSHNRELVDRLASIGYEAFTFSQPRRNGKISSNVLDRQKEIVLYLLATLFPDGEKVYAVAHSLGSAAALKAASSSSNRFSGLLLMQPPGLTGELGLAKLLSRVGKKSIQNNLYILHTRHLYKLKKRKNTPGNALKLITVTTRQVFRAQLSSSFAIIKNPALALKEAYAAIHYNIAADIVAVDKLGVPIYVFEAPRDELFKTSATNFRNAREVPEVGAFLSIADINAPHDTFWIHPERIVEIIDTIIKNLNKNISSKGGD